MVLAGSGDAVVLATLENRNAARDPGKVVGEPAPCAVKPSLCEHRLNQDLSEHNSDGICPKTVSETNLFSPVRAACL